MLITAGRKLGNAATLHGDTRGLEGGLVGKASSVPVGCREPWQYPVAANPVRGGTIVQRRGGGGTARRIIMSGDVHASTPNRGTIRLAP